MEYSNLLWPIVQTMIWEAAIPDQRVVKVERSMKGCKDVKLDDSSLYIKHKDIHCEVVATPPVLLHICSQSRAVALKYYKPCYIDILGRPVYFNLARDILWIQDVVALRWLLQDTFCNCFNLHGDLVAIHHIAIDAVWEICTETIGYSISRTDAITLCRGLNIFTELKNIYVIPTNEIANDSNWSAKEMFVEVTKMHNNSLREDGTRVGDTWRGITRDKYKVKYTSKDTLEGMLQ